MKYELTNPPVIEDVFDITIKPISETDVGALSFKNDDFIKKFSISHPIFETTFKVDVEGQASSHSKKQIGFSYKSPNSEELVQHRINGFSYHKLGKYYGWEQFIKSANIYWSEYQNLVKNIEVQRLGLRFINVIDVDSELRDTFKILPNTKSFGELSDIQYKYMLNLMRYECSAVVNLIPTTRTANSQNAKYILDIDIFKEDVGDSLKNIEAQFKKMQSAKNKIFFDTLTKEALKHYE